VHLNILEPVVEELGGLLENTRVERVYQGRGGGLIVLLGRGRQQFILLISADRAMPRLHLISAKPLAEDPPHGFILYLRSHLSGARVIGVGLMDRDRVVEIRVTKNGKKYRILFELFGSSANLVLVDASSNILAVYYPAPPLEGVTRSLQPGHEYSPPDRPNFTGSRRNDRIPGIDVASSPNRAAEVYYERLIEQRHIASLRNELCSRIRKGHARAERLVTALSEDLRAADRIDEYLRAGELILAHLKDLRTGMAGADLTGYDGNTVWVILDPKRSPSRNADLYFKKHKKARTGRGIIAARLRRASDEAAYLKSLLIDLERANDADSLSAVRSGLAERGYVVKQPVTPGRKMRQEAVPPAIRRVAFRGWDILVGKSAAGNDHLTMKIARPDDLWFHAEGMPGSHVLIRNPNGADIPPEVVSKAAALAAFHSKGRHAGKVPVTYTRAGLVKKPKGAKPGLVTLQKRKSLMVKPEE
jgi:predicted ribosome quality control (RQC) complex YloA/Tae2 family protein